MTGQLEFFFDYISPYSHIANAAVKRLETETGTTALIKPMFLGAVMQATGNRPPGMVEAKGNYLSVDLKRCADHYGVSFRPNPYFPLVNTRPLLRATIGMSNTPEKQRQFLDAVFHHMWEAPDPMNVDDPESVAAMCKASGFIPEDVLALANADENKALMREYTDDAIARGAFGAPTFFIGDEMFFGHDRLDYARRALMSVQA